MAYFNKKFHKTFLFFILVNKGSIILAAGRGNIVDHTFLEILAPNSKTKLQLPNLPYGDPSCSIFNHNGILMVCGAQ